VSRDNFARALAFTLAHEGGYTNDPRDPGGETKYGIAARFYPPEKLKAILGRAVAIADLTMEDAAAIYARDYWRPLKCDSLPWPLCLAVFDCAVVPGQSAAARILQREAGAEPDGVLGPRTMDAIAAALIRPGPVELARRVTIARLARFEKAIKRNPGLSVFRPGWSNRCCDVGWAAVG
jgi:lysozyme family protein